MIQRFFTPPMVITLVLGVVVVVNLAFAWVAVGGADPVDPTYTNATQR